MGNKSHKIDFEFDHHMSVRMVFVRIDSYLKTLMNDNGIDSTSNLTTFP